MIEELKQNISNSKWEKNNKENILIFLPLIGKNYLEYLLNESYKVGFEFTQESLCEVISLCTTAEKDILQGKFETALNILKVAPSYPWWQNGEHVLPWALDLQDKVRTDKKFQDHQLQTALIKFFISMFQNLPVGTVNFILQDFIFFVISEINVDLLSLLKKYVYFKHWNNDSESVKSFVEVMIRNQEICSEDFVVYENKKTQINLELILKDFISSSGTKVTDRGAYDITKYFISSKIIKNINDEKKDVILEFLKIFLWLQKPVINQDDLSFLNYNYLAVSKDFDINDYFKLKIPHLENPVDSISDNFSSSASDIIEQKLSELRKKVKS